MSCKACNWNCPTRFLDSTPTLQSSYFTTHFISILSWRFEWAGLFSCFSQHISQHVHCMSNKKQIQTRIKLIFIDLCWLFDIIKIGNLLWTIEYGWLNMENPQVFIFRLTLSVDRHHSAPSNPYMSREKLKNCEKVRLNWIVFIFVGCLTQSRLDNNLDWFLLLST